MVCLGALSFIKEDRAFPVEVYKTFFALTAMTGNIAMVPTPDFTSFTQPFSDETAIANWSSVSTLIARFITGILSLSVSSFVVSQDMPLSMIPAPPNVQSQPPYSIFLETPMQMFPTQIPYDATQGVVQGTYLLQHAPDPKNALVFQGGACDDNGVRNCAIRTLSTPLY